MGRELFPTGVLSDIAPGELDECKTLRDEVPLASN